MVKTASRLEALWRFLLSRANEHNRLMFEISTQELKMGLAKDRVKTTHRNFNVISVFSSIYLPLLEECRGKAHFLDRS